MDKQLDVCFDRVEKALGTLVDSIAKYHPSVAQVNELGLADVELNKGLEDCTFFFPLLPIPRLFFQLFPPNDH